MKRLFSLLLITFICSQIYAWTWVASQANVDVSQYFLLSKSQRWELLDYCFDDNYVVISIQISVLDNKAASFNIPKNAQISGEWGTTYIKHLMINDKNWDIGKYYGYDKGNKGNKATLFLYFDRFPAGIKSFTYLEPNFMIFENLVIGKNPNTETTDWTETALRNYFDTNGSNRLEGLYHFMSTTNEEWWGNNPYDFGLIKNGSYYDLIYLGGSSTHGTIWKEGDLKARFVPTAVPNLYMANIWYMENKINRPDFFMGFDEIGMYIRQKDVNVKADFLKLYPAVDAASQNYVETEQQSGVTAKPSANTSLKWSGSGVFISPSVIATNYHVVNGAKKIVVSVNIKNRIEEKEATVICSDKTNDLALLQISDKEFSGIGAIPYSLSLNTIDVGSGIFTMGYPNPAMQGDEVKITDGIISSKTGFQGDIVCYQISAAIQPGNSGGALFDKRGNLVGITNAGIQSADNVGYAIKSTYLHNLIEAAPVAINTPSNNSLAGTDFATMVKELRKFVVIIKAE